MMPKAEPLAAALLAIFCCVSPTFAQGVTTTKLILDACNSGDQTICQMYIIGVVDGLLYGADVAALNTGIIEGRPMREKANELLGVCVPDAVTGDQKFAVALAYMMAHPESWHLPAVAIIHRSLIAAFPC